MGAQRSRTVEERNKFLLAPSERQWQREDKEYVCLEKGGEREREKGGPVHPIRYCVLSTGRQWPL